MAWNAADKDASLTLINSDKTVLKASGNGVFGAVRATLGATVKRYAEVHVDNASASTFVTIGLANGSMPLSYAVGQDANSWSYYQSTGQKYTNNITSSFGASYTNGDVVGVAYDPVAGKVWFAKNNVWQASGDPAAGNNAAFSGLASGLLLAVALYRSAAPAHQISGRFVAADLAYSPPAGFTAWDDSGGGGGGGGGGTHRMFAVF